MCHAEGNPRPSVSWLHHDGIVSNTSEVYLKDSEAKNGFYSCHASSILKPDSIATLDVQRTRDLRKFDIFKLYSTRSGAWCVD